MIYDLLASVYDEVNREVDYAAWADFVEENLTRFHHAPERELILDLGCGTGRMSCELARRGYDMTGIDYSAAMLNVARARAAKEVPNRDILWLCQDICDFELYGTVGTVICCLDTVNHLIERDEIRAVFSRVHTYLVPGGLFLFDVNGRAKFEDEYNGRSYIMDLPGAFCTWENAYNPKNRLCEFCINLFKRQKDGSYTRSTEYQWERMYTVRMLKNQLHNGGFEWIGAFSDFAFSPATDINKRIYIAARCLKGASAGKES